MSKFDGLLDLAEVDARLAMFAHQMDHIAHRTERAEVGTQIDELARRAAEVEGELSTIETTQRAREAEVAEIEAKIEADEKRLYGGSITAAKDAEAVTHEIATLRQMLSEAEDGVLEMMEQAEPLSEQLGELATQRAALEERAAELDGVIDARVGELEGHIAQATSERAQVASRVDASALATYEQLWARLAPSPAVGTLDGARCTACGLSLPTAEASAIKSAGDTQEHHCSECGALLILS